MYSDSDDDSQVSQPHLLIKKSSISSSTQTTTTKTEDVVDKERPSEELISFSRTLDQETNVKEIAAPTKSPKPTDLTDKLLMRFSSNSSSETPKSPSPASSGDSMSSDGETSLGEVLEDEERKLINKSQQTSPTLFNKVSLGQNVDWEEIKKYASIHSLESTVHSPEIAPFQSKYLRNWQHQQRLYYDQKQSIESLDTAFGSKLNLQPPFDSSKPTTSKQSDPITFQRKQYGIFNFDFDEELFYKVKKLFPQVSDERIRTFMYKHHNQEHDVISATINSLSPKRERRRLKHQSAMDKVLGNYIRMHRQIDQLDEERRRLMAKEEQEDSHNYAKVEIKIKYLKLLYPAVDVLDLFYYLHSCDMKANNVAKKLEELGFKRKSLSESEESLVDSLHLEELMPELKLNFGEQQARISTLQEEYPLIDIYLVKLALKSTRFNVNEARKLLDTVDINQYKNLKIYKFDWSIDDSKFIYKTERGTQTGHQNDYYEYGRSYREERKKRVSKISKSTWTKEDRMEKLVIKQLAKGPDRSNVRGPAKREKTKLIKPRGQDARNYKGQNAHFIRGPDIENVRGSDFKKLGNDPSLARGPDSQNCRGSMKNQPKKSIIEEDDDDEEDDPLHISVNSYLMKIDNLLPMGNMFSSFNYLSNY